MFNAAFASDPWLMLLSRPFELYLLEQTNGVELAFAWAVMMWTVLHV
jgi:hypothetical protein